jgi:hypothetical protein
LSFAGEWMELENIILCELSQVQKAKGWICSLKFKQCEKQVTLREGHIQDRKVVMKVNMADVLPVQDWIWFEITIERY